MDGFTGLPNETLRADANASLSSGPLRLSVSGSRGRIVHGPYAGATDLRLEARCAWAVSRAWSTELGAGAAQTNQLPFFGWQKLLFVRVHWSGTGSL
jgi:hypothetical protein